MIDLGTGNNNKMYVKESSFVRRSTHLSRVLQ